MSYFSRLGSSLPFGRPRRHTTVPPIPMPMPMPMPPHVSEFDVQPSRTEEDDFFIPADDDDDEVGAEPETGAGAGAGAGGQTIFSGGREEERHDTRSDDPDPDEPVIPNSLLRLRPYRFRPSKQSWKHAITSGLKEKGRDVDYNQDWDYERRKPPCSAVKILTWNIDMMSASHEQRLNAALRHIQMDVLKCGKEMDQAPDPPCIIMLQEVRDTMLPRLLADEWVRKWFCIVPITTEKWPEDAQYGNITLVSRSLDIVDCQILHFGLSSMQRTALCVRLRLTQVVSNDKYVLSFVNTHLESLEQGALARPKQMEMCSRFLRLRDVHGGVIAGDMNTISQEDQSLGKKVGLADAWKGGNEEGHTWGYQGGNEGGKYPPGRLDRIYYLPGKGYKVDEPKKIGVGVKVREGGWVSDHYGLETVLHILKPRSNSA